MPRKHFHCFSSLQEKQGRQAHGYLQTDEPESCVWIITWDCFSFTGWLTRAASGLLIQPWSSVLAEGNGCIALKILKEAKRGWAVNWKLMNYINFFQMKSISDRQEWQRACKKKKNSELLSKALHSSLVFYFRSYIWPIFSTSSISCPKKNPRRTFHHWMKACTAIERKQEALILTTISTVIQYFQNLNTVHNTIKSHFTW